MLPGEMIRRAIAIRRTGDEAAALCEAGGYLIGMARATPPRPMDRLGFCVGPDDFAKVDEFGVPYGFFIGAGIDPYRLRSESLARSIAVTLSQTRPFDGVMIEKKFYKNKALLVISAGLAHAAIIGKLKIGDLI